MNQEAQPFAEIQRRNARQFQHRGIRPIHAGERNLLFPAFSLRQMRRHHVGHFAAGQPHVEFDLLRGDQSDQEPRNSLKLLTEREREIIQLLARGDSNKAIAQSLSISYDTVKQHVRHILTKLNLSSRVKAAVLFAKEGGVTSDDLSTRS